MPCEKKLIVATKALKKLEEMYADLNRDHFDLPLIRAIIRNALNEIERPDVPAMENLEPTTGEWGYY